MGIYSKGLGDVLIYNNQVIRPGLKNNLPSGKYGIYIDGVASLPGMYFNILNNLIINPKFEGIRFLNAKGAPKNNIVNNVIVQESYLIDNDKAGFINTLSQLINVSNNFTTTDMSTARFKNSMQDDYTAEAGSALIDGGANIEHQKIEFDFNDKKRNYGFSIDLGPFESELSRQQNYNETSSEIIYPNPAYSTDKTTINFYNPDEGWIEFVLLDQNGKELKVLDKVYYIEGYQIKTFTGNLFRRGMNYIVIRKRMNNSLLKLSIFEE